MASSRSRRFAVSLTGHPAELDRPTVNNLVRLINQKLREPSGAVHAIGVILVRIVDSPHRLKAAST